MTLVVGNDGRLYELGFGDVNRTNSAPAQGLPREMEFQPPAGNGFICEPAVQVTHADGNTSTDLIYVKHETTEVDTNSCLTRIELKDPYYPFYANLFLKTYAAEDVIEQWMEIHHVERGPVVIHRFASSAPLFRAREYWLTQFQGDYRHEAKLSETRLDPGIKVLDSKIGVRAARYRNPSFVLSLNGPADEESGEAVGGTLEWSGSFQLAFEVDWRNRLRALCGINPFGSEYHLARGRVFRTPGMLWTWSGSGKGQVSRNFHRWARRFGIRDGDQRRPVLLNNWEATGMDFDEQKILALFDGAREIGGDLFLLDDGWFGNRHPRNNDRAGLGDWQVNAKKLPHGLSFLADEAKKRGLKFGIWLEPEMVNPASDLYEAHPDWAIRQAHREPQLSRNQLDLDLSRPKVREFAWQVIDRTLGPNPGISYVKWDANRYVTQPGSTYLNSDEQSNLLIDYNWALYDVMGRMVKKYPNVMAMVCAGGSGRVDYGALKYFDSFWPSDNTDPRDRVFIQWGFSHIFPACTISAHVTKMGNRPLKFALDVAMSGALGVDMDVGKMTPEERKATSAAITLYKQELADVVLKGDLYRLESPYDGPRAVLEYVSPDRSRAVLFIYQMKADNEGDSVVLLGLDPQQRYGVKEVNLPSDGQSVLAMGGKTVEGARLMDSGLMVPCKNEFDSAVIELTAGPSR